jgi:hypothetical protein
MPCSCWEMQSISRSLGKAFPVRSVLYSVSSIQLHILIMRTVNCLKENMLWSDWSIKAFHISLYPHTDYVILGLVSPQIPQKIIKSRIYGSVTNNNGFLIEWLDLLTASFTITRNNNQSSAEPFFLGRRGLAPFSFLFYDALLIYDWTTHVVSRRNHRRHPFPAMDISEPHRKHRFLFCCIYSALHRNGSYLIFACVFVVTYCCKLDSETGCLPRICLRGNVFTESLPSNGCTCHNIIRNFCNLFKDLNIQSYKIKWKLPSKYISCVCYKDADMFRSYKIIIKRKLHNSYV